MVVPCDIIETKPRAFTASNHSFIYSPTDLLNHHHADQTTVSWFCNIHWKPCRSDSGMARILMDRLPLLTRFCTDHTVNTKEVRRHSKKPRPEGPLPQKSEQIQDGLHSLVLVFHNLSLDFQNYQRHTEPSAFVCLAVKTAAAASATVCVGVEENCRNVWKRITLKRKKKSLFCSNFRSNIFKSYKSK